MSSNIDMEKRDLESPVDGDLASKHEVNLKVDIENGRLAIDHVAEKKLMRKIDLNLITLFGALYLMSFLDRSNIGNANLTGFSTDLRLVNNQYGAAVSIVYATYVVFEPIWTVLLKILTPKFLMTASTLGWAALTIGTAFTKNFDQLAAVRVLLGAVEAAIIPCILMYITMTYNRDEYAIRNTYVFSASAVSGAFGGLLAYGLTQIESGGLHGWQWMYIVEGIISFCLCPITFFWLPNSVAEAIWLNKEEKELITVRLERNKGAYDSEEKFSWSEILRCFKDWKFYVQSISHFGIDTTLYAVTTFMPKIIAGLGFTTTVNAQLLTVPVYFVAAVSYLILGYLSDKYKNRSTFLLIALSSCLIGYIILIASPSTGVRYFGVFMVAIGLYATTSLNIVWAATNHAGYFKRAFATGTVQLVGNSAGAAIGFIFKTQSAPRYFEGLYFALGVTIMSITLTSIMSILLRRENRKKLRLIAEGAADQPELGDRNPHFLYYP
ncbi:MFS general substrate transporter [Mollisia scopiformis]|uniref:MFS general substrate transporter n=1 Tax=Mollisia scopiformis TaxID=149040 RepID=A0A194X3E8_MOLSC|nr:MFS general substrate transporter [Mollisia scopiformis]KUJ14691.1 MFS general substrate transporter [Mollisia scopiformis]